MVCGFTWSIGKSGRKKPVRDGWRVRGWTVLAFGVILFVFFERFGQLVGAGGAVAANDAVEFGDHVVYVHADGKAGDALRIAGTAVDKLERRQFVVFDFENDLLCAGLLGAVRFHIASNLSKNDFYDTPIFSRSAFRTKRNTLARPFLPIC